MKVELPPQFPYHTIIVIAGEVQVTKSSLDVQFETTIGSMSPDL